MPITTIENFYKETIRRKLTSIIAANIYVSALPVPTSGWLVISPNNESLREIIKYSAVGSDVNGTFVTVSLDVNRGVGGTTAQTHEVGELVNMNITAEHWSELSTTLDSKPLITTGILAPTSTPTKIGDIFVNTTGSKVYISKGTSSSADWLILN